MPVEIGGCGGKGHNVSEEILSVLSCLFYVFLSMVCLWRKFPAVAEASGS